MTKNRRVWKKYAKLAMRGNMGILAMGMFLTTVANMVANSLTNFFFSGSGIFTFVLAELFSFIVSLVLNIFAAGYAYINLKVTREENAVLGDLFYFFKNGSDRAIIAGFAMSFLQFLSSVPMIVYTFTSKGAQTPEEALQMEVHFLMLMLGALIVQMILTIPFSMSYYLLSDHPEMSGLDAVKGSLKMMKNHMGAYLLMEISFFPWILASAFTFYLALVWVIPYIHMVEAEFYRDLNGEFTIRREYLEKPAEVVVEENKSVEAIAEKNEQEDESEA